MLVLLLSFPVITFLDDFRNRREITNTQAAAVQKKASYLPYLAGLIVGLLIIAGNSLNAYFLYESSRFPLWQIGTLPLAGIIAALITFLLSFSIIERLIYPVRELADKKNTLPSLKHPGPSLFTKLFIEFFAFGTSLTLLVGLFMHNAVINKTVSTLEIIRGGMVLFLAIAILLAYIISASFASITLLPLRKLSSYLNTISLGDLTHRLLSGASDEFFSVCRSASYMVNSLKLMVFRAKDMGGGITAAAENIRHSEEQQAHGAIETAKTLANTISTLHNLADSAGHVYKTAEDVADTAQATLSASKSSQQAIDAIKTEMENIRVKVVEVVRRIAALEDRSYQINNIATTIGEISEQTNLLAINASIEASRAEGGGAGFSQVAAEIRKLAARAANSTKEIESLISEIHSDTSLTVDVTRESSSSVEKSIEKIKDTTQSIEKINQMIAQTTNAAQEILQASSDQKTSTDQIVSRIQGWSHVAQQFETSTHSLVGSIKQLNQLADDLKAAISGFKVE
ncbi:MAG: hypothetical protein HQ564_02940 [Candidatus Saganbacteria bacterium]|nr:hypothetical protein [Candidatus Saganbacteria bacterium]